MWALKRPLICRINIDGACISAHFPLLQNLTSIDERCFVYTIADISNDGRHRKRRSFHLQNPTLRHNIPYPEMAELVTF